MKNQCTPHGQAVLFRERLLASAVRQAIPYLLGLGLGLSMAHSAYGVSSDASAAFTATQLVRQFTLKNTVAQVSMGMQGQVSEVNGEQRAPAMGERPAGFPSDMGSVPATVNLPRRDGAGRPLGYCAWDNSTTVTTAGYNGNNPLFPDLVYAVVSPGLNGSMQTTCADILASGVGIGDDYVQVVAAMEVSSASYKSSVSTFANLPAGEDGDIRLVRDTNKLYSYVGGAWQLVQAGPFEKDALGNVSYTTGKVTVADFQATTATLTGALTGTSATFSGAVAANSFTGNGSGLTDLNASNFTAGVVSPQFGGTGVNGAAAANGALLIGNGTGYTLGTLTAGAGIGILNGAGSITVSNTGVTSLAGTANQVNVSASTGAVTLSLPQDIATTSTPTFGGLMLNGGLMGTTANFSGVVTVGSLTAQRLNVGTNAGVTVQNLIIGNSAMPGAQTGFGGNTAVGVTALFSNSSGVYNTATGLQALYNTTSGYYNTATGTNALFFNTTGHNNTATGVSALNSNTTGFENTATGTNALFYNTTGSINVAVGRDALVNNTAGSYNVALGNLAGHSNTTGNFNTFLGFGANSTTGALSYATAIGAQSTVATNNTIALGRNSTADQVVIGTDTRNDTYANTKLYVNGVTNLNGDLRGTTAAFSGGGAATPQVWAGSSASNYIALLANASAGAYNPNTQAGDNVVFFSNGAPNTGSLVIAPWTSSSVGLRMTTAGTTFTGGVNLDSLSAQRLNLGTNAGGVGFQNVIIGNNAMPGAQGGDGGNTAIGQSALASNSTGAFNTATGLQALLSNTSGFNNNATGVNALISNTTGYGNVAMGRDALVANTTGAYNTGLGQSAGYGNTAGNFNTFLGYGATSTSGALSYATAIGADSTVATSNTLALGRNSTGTADQVVIGTAARNDAIANTKLFVNGNTHLNGSLQVASTLTFNEVVGDKLNLWGGYGFGINNNNLAAYVPSAAQRFSVRTGGNFNGTEVFSVSGAGNMYLAGSMVSDLNVSQGYALKFAHGNQLDGNDGKIGAGLFTEGLNIVGVQTTPGNGRKTSIYGDVNVFGNLSGNQLSASSISSGSITTNALTVFGNTSLSGDLYAANTIASGVSLASTLWASGAVAISGQGAYLQWNRGGGDGRTYLVNQRGGGVGGISFGEVTAGNAYTQNMLLDSAGNLSLAGGLYAPAGVFNGTVTVNNAPINFNNILGDKLNLYSGYGFGINGSNLTAYIPGGGDRFSVRNGGNHNGGEVFYVSGAGNMYLAGSMVSDLNVSQGYSVKLSHGNQFNGDDGKITAGVYAEGLNIIGVQTNPGAGRKISVFGDMNLYGNFSANQISANSIATTSISTNSLSVNGSAAFTGSLSVPTNQVLQLGAVGESSDSVAIQRVSYNDDNTALRIIIGDNAVPFGHIWADEFQIGAVSDNSNPFSFTPTFRVAGNGDVIASGYVQATAFNVSSDRRLKNNITVQNTESVLDRLGKINTYSYGYTANPDIGRRIGVIAQELQALFPEAVATRADGMLSVDYNALGAMAAAGVGQLNNKFVVLDKKVTEQGEKLTQLDAKVSGHNIRIEALEGWKTDAVARMDGMQSAIDINIQKIAENAVAIQTNAKAIERLDDALLTLDGTVKGNTEAIGNINARWARNFSASDDGSLLTVNAVELKVSNFTAQQMRANSVYTQRLEAEIAKIAELEVKNLRANSAVANTVQAEQVNTGFAQVYAGVGAPALLFAAKADGHYTVSTSSLDGSYATATVIVNAGQAQVIPAASKGIELMAEGNMVKAIAAGKSIKASWIKMG
jgi:trimeric autotransporter adhesin